MKKAKRDSLKSEKDQQLRVKEIHTRAGSLRLAFINIKEGSDIDLMTDGP